MMKRLSVLVPLLFGLLASCERDGGRQVAPDPDEAGIRAAKQADCPLLPVEPGDEWEYEVSLEIPPGVTSRAAAAVDTGFVRKRRYLGKVQAADGLPATDCFEVTVPGSPDEREFVEIRDDRILLRGSLIMRPETTRPLWFDHPVPFVEAGMRPGTEAPIVSGGEGAFKRRLQVIARENVVVPAGEFSAIRLLMTGTDGDMELRRTIWFAPGTGIVREEKARYRSDRLLFREKQELVRTTVGD